MHYQVICAEEILDAFIATLPELERHEVWYICLFGRHKYDPLFPNTKDSGQLARVVARNKYELKEKLRRLETPLGSYTRDGVTASQECLATYMTMNPRSLIRANKLLAVQMMTQIIDGDLDFNPISLSTTAIHKAVDRKFVVDFDFDDVEPEASGHHLTKIRDIFPDRGMYRVLKTRGGFHLLVDLKAIKSLKSNWHQELSKLPNCDVRGTATLTPVPGCTQGGFIPYFI